jgi:NAD+ kinase
MNIAILAANTPKAAAANAALLQRYKTTSPDDADVLVALGGDGFMLETLHRYLPLNKPVYGMNLGTVGFLMNSYTPDGLLERLHQAAPVSLHPLMMTCTLKDDSQQQAIAINEVSLFRETRQSAWLRVEIDGVTRLPELCCDGIILATPAGSTAYNLSANGAILPLTSNMLALTPLSAFRPRRWRGALLPHTSVCVLEVLDAQKRPVSAVADFTEIRDVRQVRIAEQRDINIVLLFDPQHHLEERILKEQFIT